MKTKSLLLGWLMVLFVSGIASAQIIFEKVFVGPYNAGGYSVQQTTDLGYIMTGFRD